MRVRVRARIGRRAAYRCWCVMRARRCSRGRGRCSSVQSRMSLEVARGAESLIANIALMRLLARMNEMMLLQVRQLCETLCTNIAMKWALACVSAQVHL